MTKRRPSFELKNVYGEAFEKHGATLESIYWNDRESQRLRFERLLCHLDLTTGTSLLDVGAGFADLYGYMQELGYQVAYTGVELVEGMVGEACLRHPGLEMIIGDVFEIDSDRRWDFVVQSGIFNLPGTVPRQPWREYCWQLVEQMFSLSLKGIAFNALTSRTTFRNEELAYFEVSYWEELLASKLTRHFVVDHGYPLFEYTITAYTPESVADEFKKLAAFAKYFPIDPRAEIG